MLKIKDNVDLKELKKYGFKRNYNYKFYVNVVCEFSNNEYIAIYKQTREISIMTNGWQHEAEILLFDLIQAGFVEKV